MRMLLGALAFAATIVHGSVHAGQVQTLYTSPAHQRIQAFAQDGELLAWFEPNATKCNAVWVWQLGSEKVQLPSQEPSDHNVTCKWQVYASSPVGLALASNAGSAAVLWTLRESASPALRFDYVLGTTVADPKERRFQQVAHARQGAGLWLGGVAGGDGSLVYAVVQVEYHDQVACLSTPKAPHACDLEVTGGGGVYRVVGRQPPLPIKGAGPAVAVATSGDDVAYVPATSTSVPDGEPLASASVPVEIRDVHSGSLVASVAPEGTPLAVGLSNSVLALLTRTPAGLVLSWYAKSSGKIVHAVSVAPTTSAELAVGTSAIVYRVGRAIRAVDLRTGKIRALAKAAATPIGLSIAGDRVAWAENIAGRGRIRAVTIAP